MENIWQWLIDQENWRLISEIFILMGGLTGWKFFFSSGKVLSALVDAIEIFSTHHKTEGSHLKKQYIATISEKNGADKQLNNILIKKKYSNFKA